MSPRGGAGGRVVGEGAAHQHEGHQAEVHVEGHRVHLGTGVTLEGNKGGGL